MKLDKRFHYLVRAVILDKGKVLLAKAKGASNTFLPGGHVEIGETMHEALHRELKEELRLEIKIQRYLGVIEHKWVDNQVENFEINHCFLASFSNLGPNPDFRSLESHLEFVHAELGNLNGFNLKPSPLIDLIANLLTNDREPWFASTF
jgi:8-oxo-dGTP diphosphatase